MITKTRSLSQFVSATLSAFGILSKVIYKNKLYRPSDSLELTLPLPSVIYLPGPIASKDSIEYITSVRLGLIKPKITKIYYDWDLLLPCYHADYHDSLALIKHEFIRYDKFNNLIYDKLGFNIKGVVYNTLVIFNRIMHTYSSSRGYGMVVLKPIILLYESYLKSNNLFVWKGALMIRRVFFDRIEQPKTPDVIYGKYPEGFGGLVPYGYWEECRAIAEKELILLRNSLALNVIYNSWIGKVRTTSLLERFIHYRFNTYKDIMFVYEDLLHIVNVLRNTNLSIGYVKTDNIFDKWKYPIINEVISKLIDREGWDNTNNMERTKIYKWAINILILTIFKQIKTALKVMESMKVTAKHSYYMEYLDLLSKLTILGEWCFKHLDNSLKQHLVKKNPYIKQEVISGLDTEYIPQNFGLNKLLSVQTSTTGVLKIFIPIYKNFIFEGVNTLTNETFIISPPKFKFQDYSEVYINTILLDIRELSFGQFDRCLLALAKAFARLPNVKIIKRNELGYLFQLKKHPIINNIFLAAPGETLKVSWNTLIASIKDVICFKDQMEKIIDIIFSIDYFKKNNFVIQNKETPSWNASTLKIKSRSETILSNEDNLIEHLKSEQPKKIVFTARDVGIDNTKIVFNVNKSVYLYGHYNAADLSMLDGFKDIIKRNVDILKKSYVSLFYPIKTLGEVIYLRDTCLLASAVANSLKAIGQAHGLHKIDVGNYITKMDELLKDKPGLFKSYAMQDSLITLIHALFMNDFACTLGSLRNPVTLGSLASKYIGNVWRKDQYRGYQVDINYPLGSAQVTHTPKGITSLGVVGESLNLFLGCFRGGRNECFAYGIDTKEKWFDYDLTSCYSSVMSMCGDPIYGDGLTVIQESSPPFVPHSDDVHRKNIFDLRTSDAQNITSSGVGLPTFPPVAPLPPVPPVEEGGGLGGGNLSSSLESEQGLENFELGKLFPGIASTCGHPDYSKAIYITNEQMLQDIDFKQGYSALRVDFKFPPEIMYPPLPVSLDKDITIYPLSGNTLVTGLEFLSAKNILNMCKFKNSYQNASQFYLKVLHGVFIPFAKDITFVEGEKIETLKYKPFYSVIKELQANRKKWRSLTGKGSAMERIYKDLGNMLYGKVVSGISNKTSFDARTESMKAMEGSNLTNPIIGCWITGFVRALLAELLYVTDQLGGKVTAVTTDGFVANIEDLESKVMEYLISNKQYENSFLKQYRDIRVSLSSVDTPEALEVKTSVKGLAQWTTRGQMSLNVKDICAMTGFQKHLFSFTEIMSVLKATLGNGNEMMFLQNRLTGALDHYKYGSDVSMMSSLRVYRTVFDTKRLIITMDDNLHGILYSKPFDDIEQANLFRKLITQLKTGVYSASYTEKSSFITTNDICIETLKYFIRVCLEFYNFIPTLDQKRDIIELIKLGLKEHSLNYTDDKILKMINTVLFRKGVIMNQLNIFKDSTDLVELLRLALSECSTFNSLNNVNFLNLFLKKFSNFYYSPSLQLAVIPEESPKDYLAKLCKAAHGDILALNSINEIIKTRLKDENSVINNLVSTTPAPFITAPAPTVITAPSVIINQYEVLELEIELLENEISALEAELEIFVIKNSLFNIHRLVKVLVKETKFIINNLIFIIDDQLVELDNDKFEFFLNL